MDVVQKALWYVESHSRGPIALDEIADACAVSPFHLTRAFAATTGRSLMRYVRARRLTEAARRLAGGAGDILALALDAGYGSHEAFTRAFREHFGLTPEQTRARGHLDDLALLEAIPMSTASATPLSPPRFEQCDAMLLAGLVERYDCQAPNGIPEQWQRLAPHLGRIADQVGPVAYGAVHNFDSDGHYDYLSGVQVAATDDLPKGFRTLHVPAARCVIFMHHDHIASIGATFAAIWSRWFPESGLEAAAGPTLECYGPRFDPRTGTGGVEIRIPLNG